MTKTTFPVTLESLTSEWLTTVLRADGVLKSGRVTGFSAEPLSGGYTSQVYRVLLEFEGNADAAPPSLIIKFHGESVATRAMFEGLRIYEKEVRFYQTLDRDRELPVPVCFAAEFDSNNGNFVLLLEDLSAARPGSWELDPIGDIHTALTHLADLHAAFWGDPRLEQHDWIVQVTDLRNPPPTKSHWALDLSAVKLRYYDQLSASTWSICDKWLEHWDEVMLCIAQDTHTLVHTDVHLEQMFFPTDELPRFVLFDWQYPSKSWGAEDVTHLIVTDLDIEDRRLHEEKLINHYFDCLCQQGVSDLTRERFWFQCKLSLLWIFFMFFKMLAQPDMRQTLLAEIEAAGEELKDWIFDPLEAVTEDWKLTEILDQAIDEGLSIRPKTA